MKNRKFEKVMLASVLSVSLLMQAGTALAAETGETLIELSDEKIMVAGEEISEDTAEAVHVGAEIIYYEAGHDATYGEGDESDAHTPEEAAEHTVVTITQPGTYRVTGSISKGQIAVDLGEDAEDDENAVVSLILDNAEINCSVASAIVVINAYECGDDDEEDASMNVDTSNAGFHLIVADDTENKVNGSHVAKIYEEGTTQEEVDADEAEKLWKFDGAVDSLVSFTIDGEEKGNGKLFVTADREGIQSALHMTINGGSIVIDSGDDAMNASEDYVSVITINSGSVTCNSNLGSEGDGIDSNGWLLVNGGNVAAFGNSQSQDSGLDSDLGIYINGGTVFATGNMYDQISQDSAQKFMVFSFAEKVEEDSELMLKTSSGEAVVRFGVSSAYQNFVYSSDVLEDGDYTFYKNDAEQQHSGSAAMGMNGGFGGRGGQVPEGIEPGEMPEMSEGMEPGEMPDVPEGMEPGEMREMPEGMEPGEMPEVSEGMERGNNPQFSGDGKRGVNDSNQEASTTFTVSGISNMYSQVTDAA